MSVTQRPGWFTSDDKYFADPESAEAHEYQLNRAAVIEEFLHQGDGSNYTDRGKSSATRIIGHFIDFLVRSGAPLPWVDEEEIQMDGTDVVDALAKRSDYQVSLADDDVE